jgi:hypothetical protein
MIRTIQRHMRYVFSDAEKAELAIQMSEANKDTKSKEATKKAITAQLKADVEAAQSEEEMIFQKFNDGFEVRETGV